MVRYETLMLVRPDVTNDEFSSLEGDFARIVEGVKGKLSAFDRWGKYRLAYPVQKNSYGVYALARFEVAPTAMQKLLDDLQLHFRIKANDVVMRHVNYRLATDAPQAYQRPDSLDTGSESRLDPSVRRFAKTIQQDAAPATTSSQSDEQEAGESSAATELATEEA